MQLVAADALLAAAHQKRSLEPHVQWHVARLKYGVFTNRELTATLTAFLQAEANAALLILHAIESIDASDAATVRADRAIRADYAFQLSKRCGLIVEVRSIEDAIGHGPNLSGTARI